MVISTVAFAMKYLKTRLEYVDYLEQEIQRIVVGSSKGWVGFSGGTKVSKHLDYYGHCTCT